MKLKLLLPERVLLEEEVEKVIAEGRAGRFCLLPRHVSFVAALVPGILSYTGADGREKYAAVDEGILIKIGGETRVSVRDAVTGENLAELEETVAARFEKLDEHEKMARSALARLEAGAIRRFMEMGKTVYE
ncbi:MAG: F0F1 ATP synthase subunit epsilon [Candidatus Nitrospinota bacterium M3_3B_026]